MSNTYPTDLRSYFAANAPDKIPDWFQPAMDHLQVKSEKPEMPKALADFDIGGMGVYGFNIAAYLGTPHEVTAKKYDEDLMAWQREVKNMEVAQEKFRYFAWRWHYADEMVQANPRKPRVGLL